MTPRFAVGQKVTVRVAYPRGHIRTPYYIRGKSGVIERVLAEFGNPENLAYGRYRDPKVRLYRVRFRQKHVWPDYRGKAGDTVDVEIYEHWLEPNRSSARRPAGAKLRLRSPARRRAK